MKEKIEAIKEHVSILKRLWNWMLNHFFLTVISLYILTFIFVGYGKSVWVIVLLVALIVYIILYLANRIRVNIYKLLHHEIKLRELITGYITSVIFLILLFGLLYWSMAVMGAGYLRYGGCTDNTSMTRESILNDPYAVKNILHYPYFSSITLFTVGYGDVCPMGWAKTIAVLNAFIGSAFNVLILAIAITNYSTNKYDERNGKKKKR